MHLDLQSIKKKRIKVPKGAVNMITEFFVSPGLKTSVVGTKLALGLDEDNDNKLVSQWAPFWLVIWRVVETLSLVFRTNTGAIIFN